MKRSSWLLIAAIAAAIVIAYLVFRPSGGEHVVADFVKQFDSAKEKRPNAGVFSVIETTIGGVKKQGIFVKDPSRIVYSVAVPENAELHVSPAILEEAWTQQGDGVLFRILVTPQNGTQDEILNLVLNPFANPSDRNWHDLTLDLSEYAGETVDIFFNTNASPPSRPQRDDHTGDLAIWGAPRVITR